jgi:hypothetical protein
MLTEILLREFINTFVGYGDFASDHWFIGMEEGGGGSLDEVSRRLAVWESHGKPVLEDVSRFHEELGMPEYFHEPVKLQRTWAQLCRVFLSSQELPDDVGAVRQFQKGHLGRENDSTRILELLPLPSPGTNRWFYPQWSTKDFLQTREDYMKKMIPLRIGKLRERIRIHKPTFVVCYGVGYSDYWGEIAGVPFQKNPSGFSWGENGKTLFVIMTHPVAQGVTNQYFRDIGVFLKDYGE